MVPPPACRDDEGPVQDLAQDRFVQPDRSLPRFRRAQACTAASVGYAFASHGRTF